MLVNQDRVGFRKPLGIPFCVAGSLTGDRVLHVKRLQNLLSDELGPRHTGLLRDVSRLTKLPFSYLARVTLLSLAQAWLSLCSGLLTFTYSNYHFRQAKIL